MNLNQVTVPSLNVSKSIEFYKLIGLKLIVHSHDKYARFECPNGDSTFSVHEVSQINDKEGLITYFETDNLDAEYSRLRGLGIEFELEPTDQEWLWREAHLRDPFKNKIILYTAGENRKNPPWRILE